MEKRRNRTVSEWQKLVADFDNSGVNQSKSEYCRKVGVSPSSFCKWHHRLSSATSNFTKVPVQESFKPRHFWVKLFGLKLIRLELDV